ncbi:MAG: DUF3102 domain-containing protein, partial [Candidatus Thiodiazotropha sp. (ex Lucinoma annulata)]|nr:DUF3102 domain-containing protein [Candidatus Thiodiazotropha sp. (ex Lucinoma annulata)]
MPRRKTTTAKAPTGPKFPTATPQDLRDDEAAVRQQATERELQLKQIDSQFGNDLAFDRDRIVSETKFFISVISQSILEIGSRLIRLKEHQPHGEFQTSLEEIGIHPREARRMMQATAKFAGTKSKLASLGKTKLLELMVEDDEELEALAEGGTLAGLTLDEVDRMSTRELRDSLRAAREKWNKENETHERLLSDKNKKIDELAKQLNNGPVIPEWPELAERVNVESTQAAGRILLACDQLDAIQDQILNGDYQDMAPEDTERATELMAVTYLQALEQAHTRIGELMDMCAESLEGYTQAYQ